MGLLAAADRSKPEGDEHRYCAVPTTLLSAVRLTRQPLMTAGRLA